MKTLLITANLTNTKDFSGLPEYNRRLLLHIKKSDNIKVLNINSDSSYTEEVRQEEYGLPIVSVYTPHFFDSPPPYFLSSIMSLIGELHEAWGIEQVIYPDFLFHQTIDLHWFKENNIKRVMFIHLLNRGMLNAMLKQPFYGKLIDSVNYLTNSSFLEWTMIKESDSYICNSKITEYDLKRYYPEEVYGKPILTAPLGIKKENFPFSPASNGSWMFFGRLSAQKGVFYITKDIVGKEDRYKQNPPIFAGEGELESGIIKAWFYDKTVTYAGSLSQPELIKKLNSVQFCVFPSIYEPWGQVITEAMSMGKICIVQSGANGMTEQIKDGYNGFHFDFKEGSIIDFIDSLKGKDLSHIAQNAHTSARSFEQHFLDIKHLFT